MNGFKLQLSSANATKSSDERIWIYDNKYHALFAAKSDFCTLKLCEKYDFPVERKTFFSRDLFAVQDDIFIMGSNGNTVIRYNVSECKSYYYDNSIPDGINPQYFFYKWGNKIVGIPYELKHCVIVFHLDERKCENINGVFDVAINLVGKNQVGIQYQDHQYVYIPIKNTGYIIKFDLSHLVYEMKQCGKEYQITTCCKSANKLFFAVSGSEQIYQCDENGEITKLNEAEKKYEKDQFSALISLDNYIVALPRFTNKISVFYFEDGEAKTIFVPDAEKYIKIIGDSCLCNKYIVAEESIITLPWVYPYVLKINPACGDIKVVEPIVSYEDACKIIGGNLFSESIEVTLQNFINMVGSIDGEKNVPEAGRISDGAQIYQTLDR